MEERTLILPFPSIQEFNLVSVTLFEHPVTKNK